MATPGMAPALSRRRALQAAVAVAGGLGLAACSGPRTPLRVALHPWPGYEFLYLAYQSGKLEPGSVQLVETLSATGSLEALKSGKADGACLTLDEVLSARQAGTPLIAVAVLDVSLGADALLASAGIGAIQDLRGVRIGVEKTAVGAVMLEAALRSAGLQPSDVTTVYLQPHEQIQAYQSSRVQALVAYEPVKTRVIQAGGRVLFSSADIPGKIVDVLAVRTDALSRHSETLRKLIRGHFDALALWRLSPGAFEQVLSARLGLKPGDVQQAFQELALPGPEENRRMLGNGPEGLTATARRLVTVMQSAGLMQGQADLTQLSTADLIP